MIDRYWILEGRTPRRATSYAEWARWFFVADRHVRLTELHTPGAASVTVSTVFLGIDHSWRDGDPPLLFETMIFGGSRHEEQHRHAMTWDEAEAGHLAIVAELIGNVTAAAYGKPSGDDSD